MSTTGPDWPMPTFSSGEMPAEDAGTSRVDSLSEPVASTSRVEVPNEGACEAPDLGPDPNASHLNATRLKHEQVQKSDLKKLKSEVAKEELDMVDPLSSVISDIGEQLPTFPVDILKVISNKIKEKFNNTGTKTLLTTTMSISIASSLFNILKDIYVACVSHTPGAMTMCVLGIVTSLASLAAQIASLCIMHKVDFSLESSLAHISESIAPHINGDSPHSEISALDKFKAWIPRIMTFVATSVAAGLAFLPKGSAIGTLISSYGNSKKIGEDISSVMSNFLTDVVGITLEGDPAYVDALVKLNKEGTVLLTTPMHLFHVDMKARAKLVSYPNRVDTATLHRTNNDTFKTLRMTLQSLQATRNCVVQRIHELFDCAQRTLRQEPVGIYLAGMGGIGKSYFAKEIARSLARECNYEGEIYCIDKCEQNFYEPYKGEAVGIANEFMSKRAEAEPLLRDINKICSEDYFNFEGAALHTKNQPCHLKTVILTSNSPNPDMTRVQEPSVTEAMWSRFKRFEVKDPRFRSAGEARTNPNRLERGSQFLEFHEYDTDTSRNVRHIKIWKAEEVIAHIVEQCRRKEKNFLQKILADNPYNFDEAGLADTRSKLAILEGLVPCAKDGRVFTVRLEGPPGTGKTYFMERKLVPAVLNTFPSLVLHRWSTSNPIDRNDKRFFLVIVDDTLDGAEKEYFEMLKHLSNRSMVIIGTNTLTKPTKTWASSTLGQIPFLGVPFYCTPAVDATPIPGVPSGFWRRIGIADSVRIGEHVYEPYVSDVAHFRFDTGYTIKRDGKQLAFETVEEEIIEKFISYLQEAGDFIWSERRLNLIDPTVKIIARSYTDMVQVLSGSAGMTALLTCFKRSGTSDPDPRMQIFLDPYFMQLVFGRAGVEEWRVPDKPLTGPTRLHVAEKISAFLRKFKPDATVIVSITNPGLDDGGLSTEPHLYELKGQMGYYTESSLQDLPAQITYDQFGVRVHSTNEVVTYEECAMIEKEHEFPYQYKPTTLRVIRQTKLDHPQVAHARMNYTRKVNFAEEMATAKVVGFFKHPAVITLLAIIGALSVAGIVYGIYAACRRACSPPADEEGELEPCDDTNDSRDGRQRKAAAAALRKGKAKESNFTWGDLAKIHANKLSDKDAKEIEDAWGLMPSLQPYEEELKTLSPQVRKELSSILKQANLAPSTVTPEMELKRHYDPRLSVMMEKVTGNLVTVSGHGSNYGLVFEGDILITTGHTVAGLENVRVSSHEFTGTAKVLRVSVPRDIAILQLIKTDLGKKPKQFPSLRKYFLAGLVHLDQLAWFVKPFTRNTVFVCGKMHSVPAYKCYSSHLSDTFNPSEWIITFFQHKMNWSPTLFQKGECGLPLFVEINGQYKICGIFNAANQMQHTTFASVSAADFNNTAGYIPMSEKICEKVEYRSEASGCPEFTANEFVATCLNSISLGNVTHVEAEYPIPIGHCTKLRSHSYPTHKARPLVPNNKSAPGGLENTQRLSCLNESLSPDITLPRRSKFENGKRVAHSKEPLFLQIQKYSKAPGFKADKQTFARAVKEVTHSYKVRLGITSDNPLSLLTVKECLNGVRHGALGGFSRDTGAGPTLKAKFNITNKKDVLHRVLDEPPVVVLAENAAGTWVKNAVSEKLNAIMNGIPVLLLTKACRKVEKIDKESWQKAKVRLFTECDFEDNILLKMLFGDLQNKLAMAPGTPVLLNMNPYTMAGIVAELMGGSLENLIGTDITSMDKHFPHEMIIAFIQICGELYCWPKPVRRAIACTLMFPLQNFEGDVFFSDCGNLSGWFPTALINCVAQELMIAYDRIKNSEGPLPFDVLKTPAEPYAILGDDKIQRLTPARAKAQEESYLDCGFIMQAGSKLQSKEERFCSRVIYRDGPVYFGALKISAISGLIYYASSSELEAIIPNFSLALFEAALHEDPKVYEKALTSIRYVAEYNSMELDDLASRERYREIYEQYCTGLSTVLNFCGHRPDILSILEHCKMGDNARMALNQYAQQTKQAPPVVKATHSGPAHSPTWTVDLSYMGKSYVGTGESKSSAAEKAASAALQELSVKPAMNPDCVHFREQTVMVTLKSNITPVPTGFFIETYKLKDGFPTVVYQLHRKSMAAAKRAAKDPGFQFALDLLVAEHLKFVARLGGRVCVWFDSNFDVDLKLHCEEGVRYFTDSEGKKYMTGAVMQTMRYNEVFGALQDAGCQVYPTEGRIYYPGFEGPCMGPDTPIQPETLQQSAMNTGAMTIPQVSSPQPTGQLPTMAPPATKITSALESISVETLNPLGPPNMLGVGAIVFDLKDLVYGQFLDCDQQFVITDDTPPGSVLLQIPYDPQGEWVNPYIRQYVSQHERYTGPLQFRITIVGNTTFSGLIGLAWQPRRVTTPIVSVAEMQKYSSYGVTVELPSNKVLTLNDARQSQFWRSTLDSDNVDDRPHLVLFTLLSLVSPLREGIQTRLRIASKLPNGSPEDGIGRSAFQVANPVISSAPTLRNASVAQSTRLADLVPDFSGAQVFMYTDGVAYGGRGDSLDPSTRPFGGANDQFNMYVIEDTGINFQRPVSANSLASVESDMEIQTLNMSAALQIGNLVGNARTIRQTGFCLYETNNLPSAVFDEIKTRVFADRRSILTPLEWLIYYVEKLADPNTFTGMNLLGIYGSPQTDLDGEFKVPSAMYQVPLLAGPTAAPVIPFTRNAPAVTTIQDLTTSFKLVFKEGMMVATFAVASGSVDVGNAVSTFQAISSGTASNLHSCVSNPLWRALVPYPTHTNFAPWTLDAQAAAVSPALLPAGWAKLSITKTPPSVVIPSIFTPTTLSSANLEAALARRAVGLPSSQCLAFDLVDPVSNRRICSARYLQESGDIVCNLPSTQQNLIYASYPAGISEALLNNFGPTERSNAFTFTDTSIWLSRKGTTLLSNLGLPIPKKTEAMSFAALKSAFGEMQIGDSVPHAMTALAIAGGAMSGLGSGLNAVAQRKHEMKMQGNTFSHQLGMVNSMHDNNLARDSQSHGFNLERDSQSHNHALEQMMTNFGFTNQLQEQQFQHDHNMSDQRFKQQQSMAFASSPSRILSGATTRSSHI